MKITIDERPESSGIEVAIVCRKTDQQVLDIVARLRMFDRKVTGSADGGTHVVNAEDILYVDLIESVDSVELLRDIDARARKLGVTQDVLIEVNIAGELSKSGVEPQKLEELLSYAAELGALRVRGLMSIPPISEAPGANRPYFAKMRELFVDIGRKKYDNTSMDLLSMGMSGDFEDAIAEGANMVRVGSAIFGARDYGAKH